MKKQNRIWLYGLFALCIILLGGFIASPYWVLYQLRQAFEQNQPEKISQYIDFPAVKASLKPQIQQLIDDRSGLSHMPDILQSWGGKLSALASDAVVDATVNPTTLMLLMQGKALKDSIQISDQPHLKTLDHLARSISQISNRADQNQPTAQANSTLGQSAKPNPNTLKRASAGYSAWNRFDIHIPVKTENAVDIDTTTFSMQRNGVSWKIVSIQLATD